MMNKTTEQFKVRIPTDQLDYLRQRSEEEDRTIASLLRQYVSQGINAEQPTKEVIESSPVEELSLGDRIRKALDTLAEDVELLTYSLTPDWELDYFVDVHVIHLYHTFTSSFSIESENDITDMIYEIRVNMRVEKIQRIDDITEETTPQPEEDTLADDIEYSKAYVDGYKSAYIDVLKQLGYGRLK